MRSLKKRIATVTVLAFALAVPVQAGAHDERKRDKRDTRGKVVHVTPKKMHGWSFVQEGPVGAGAMVKGPKRPPRGKGSAQLQVNDTGREILVNAAYQGTPLRDFTRLTYWTYRQHGTPPLAISMQFNIDPDLSDANEAYQGRLVYEPYFSHTVLTNTWQRWNTRDNALPGNWWFSNAAAAAAGGCSQATPCTWAKVLANYPNAGVHRTAGAVLLRAGGPWLGGFVGNTDALAIGVKGKTTVYDFEPSRGGHDDDEDEDDD